METSEQIDMCTSFLEPPAVLMLTVDYIYLEKKKNHIKVFINNNK